MFNEEYFLSFSELVCWFENNTDKIQKLKNKDVSFYMLFNEKKQIDIIKLINIVLSLDFKQWEYITNFVIALITQIESFCDFKKLTTCKNYKYIENNINRRF